MVGGGGAPSSSRGSSIAAVVLVVVVEDVAVVLLVVAAAVRIFVSVFAGSTVVHSKTRSLSGDDKSNGIKPYALDPRS